MKRLKKWFGNLYHNYKHLLILSYFFIYMAWFSYIEKTVTTHFHVVHVPLDDYIPFCEYFVIPYILWFFYVAWGVAYMAFHNKQDYYKLCKVLFTGMTVFLVISTIYPNGHFLRPYYFSHHNFCTAICEWLYAADTPTNLFPSIHVYNSLAVHFAVRNSRELKEKKTVRFLSLILCISIILSTMLIKQHSVFDVVTAFILAFAMYRIVYVKDYSRTVAKSADNYQKKHRLPQV